MAESALPYPTPTRLRLADAAARGQIADVITARAAELVDAGLVRVVVELTPDGMAWVTRARTAEATKCERCDNRPAVSRCCSSHGKNLCHRCYRITHFVEVCSKTCALCAAEGLPKVLTGGSKIDIRGPGSTSPEPGPPADCPPGCGIHSTCTKDGPTEPDDQCCPAYPNCHEPVPGPLVLRGADLLTDRGPAAVNLPALPWPDFNPAYRVVRCGQSSAHGPHFMDHGPDQPRNCPGTGDAAWERYQRWAAGHSTEDGAA